MSFIEAAQLLGNLGEFVGAAAIVVTLINIALQIRENTKTNLVTARQYFAQQAASILQEWIDNPELDELTNRGLTNPAKRQ